jgi:hypothetical protein
MCHVGARSTQHNATAVINAKPLTLPFRRSALAVINSVARKGLKESGVAARHEPLLGKAGALPEPTRLAGILPERLRCERLGEVDALDMQGVTRFAKVAKNGK